MPVKLLKIFMPGVLALVMLIGCYVVWLREDGESRESGKSEQPGYYVAGLESDFLRPGMSCQVLVNHHCVDCRQYKGSTALKPDFWQSFAHVSKQDKQTLMLIKSERW